MNFKISPIYINAKESIFDCIYRFNNSGELFGNGDRNKIKLFDLDGTTINIKSFKIPNIINKVAYKYFRKSKAKRSFEFATILLEKGIGTPQPVAFLENFNWLGLRDSYYASEHMVTELTYRELIEVANYPDYENILRQFTRFTFKLHEKGIEFLDHSPGNTLIKKCANNEYEFFLVDLNRMNFHTTMSFEQRMDNFRRLTPKKEMVALMSNEYAKLYPAKTETEIFEKMWQATEQFQYEFAKKKRLKKKLKFWKS
ncbi:Kdo domain containing protein [Flavobacterium branchiarum]|uniref:Kdo domain containing protein n=1 Tax=Flavobacterium branchiarum TaxID=1114870 RepID=A0ABV5FHI6_9FLAO|nr:Kdo domain containing protein [Flavobacterium branchiarum]MDN3673907.1 Kdo domain containing protein [Flavobacterium branchiarum]